MANPGGEWIGLKEANGALRKLPDFAKKEVQQTNDVTAFQFVRIAQARVPVRTGTLRDGLKWESRPQSLSAVVGRSKAAWYWRFVEFGTRYVSARPFMRPTADEMGPDHDKRLMDALSRAASQVEREGKRG